MWWASPAVASPRWAALVTRLLEPTGGKVEFQGKDITHLSTGGMRPLRRDVQMIFQDPFSSLNPRHTIGTIVSAPFKLQGVKPEGGIKKEVQRMLEVVGLNPEHYNRYPHEFSGGQRQRIGIARALALNPKLVVADEPVSALDVSIQAQVVNLLDDLQQELGLTYVIIAHDLSVVRHVSDRIAVMYLGKIVELADRDSLYTAPMHPYTKALMSAVPIPDPARRNTKSERILLRGDVPSPISPPSGCRFHTRCWKATQICKTTEPPLLELKPGQQVACHHPENAEDQAPQDVVLLSAAKEAIELVPEAVRAEGASAEEGAAAEETPAAEEALEVAETPETSKTPKAQEPVTATDTPAATASTTEPEEAAEAADEPETADETAADEADASAAADEAAAGEEPAEAEAPAAGDGPAADESAAGDEPAAGDEVAAGDAPAGGDKSASAKPAAQAPAEADGQESTDK